MHHECSVGVVERSRVDELDLATTDLFGMRPQDRQPHVGVRDQRRQSDTGSEPRGGDDVVSAGVPDAGERVVLRADHDVSVTVADPGAKLVACP